MAPKWRKNGIWGHFSLFLPFLGLFSPFRAVGHFLSFGRLFPHFRVSARLTFHRNSKLAS